MGNFLTISEAANEFSNGRARDIEERILDYSLAVYVYARDWPVRFVFSHKDKVPPRTSIVLDEYRRFAVVPFSSEKIEIPHNKQVNLMCWVRLDPDEAILALAQKITPRWLWPTRWLDGEYLWGAAVVDSETLGISRDDLFIFRGDVKKSGRPVGKSIEAVPKLHEPRSMSSIRRRVRPWLTLDEAAIDLSNLLTDKIDAADLLRYALDGLLDLSIHFPKPVHLRKLAHIPDHDARALIWCSDMAEQNVRSLEHFKATGEEMRAQFIDDCSRRLTNSERRSGVFGFPLIGSQTQLVVKMWHELMNDPLSDVECNGVYVTEGDNAWQLQRHESLVEFALSGWESRPATEIMPLGRVVITTAALTAFQSKITERLPEPDEQLHRREKSSYLNIIGGLLRLMLDKSPAGNRQSVFESQAKIIDALESHFPSADGISRPNLEKRFAEAKRSLGAQP